MTNLFEWQRAMRSASLPGSVKLLLWTIGSYASADGRDARPASSRLCSDTGLSRQRVFELLRGAQEAGWITRVSRPGRATEYVLTLPYPSDVSDGSDTSNGVRDTCDPSDTSYRSEDPDPSDPSDGSTIHPSDPSDDTRQTHLTRPTQDQTTGDAPSPDPWRNDPPQAPGRTDQPLPDSRDGPDANSSPKPSPPPRVRRRRGRHLRAVS